MEKLNINSILDRDEKSNTIKDILKSFEANKNNMLAEHFTDKNCLYFDDCANHVTSLSMPNITRVHVMNSDVLRPAPTTLPTLRFGDHISSFGGKNVSFGRKRKTKSKRKTSNKKPKSRKIKKSKRRRSYKKQ
jgi:hypothetical protein